MDTITKVSSYLAPVSSPQPRRPSILTPVSFRPVSSSSFPVIKSIKSSSSSSYSNCKILLPIHNICKSQVVETLSPSPNGPNSILRTALVASVTAIAVFSTRFSNRPLLAAPITPPTPVESTKAQSLRDQIKLKIKENKIPQAIKLLEKQIHIQPEEMEWRILRGEMLSLNGDIRSAKSAFLEIIHRNPLQLEAYHGLFMTAARARAQLESTKELDEVNDLIENAMVTAKGEKLRGFKLMYAQIRYVAGDLKESLRIYDELISENVEDFRPYLYKGVIHAVTLQQDEAEKSFKKYSMYRKLIPEDHPHIKQCDENIIATYLLCENTNYEGDRK